MILQAQLTRDRSTAIHRAGRLCLWAALLGVVSGVYLAVVHPVVDENQWSYPLSAGAFVAMQLWFAVQHVGLLVGLLALGWSGAVGSSRAGRWGNRAAVWGMIALSVTELAAIAATTDSNDSGRVAVLGAMYGLCSVVIGVGLVVEGVAIFRTRVWSGWMRWIVLALGGWVFVPMLPLLAASFVGARLAISGWMLLFAALGWGLSHTAVRSGLPVTRASSSGSA